MPIFETSTWLSFVAASFFAAIFLFGGRVNYSPSHTIRLFLLSFADGISVAYTFVHVLPGLQAIKEFQKNSPDDFILLFPEYSVYLWCMCGFLVFFGLEIMWAGANTKAEEGSKTQPAPSAKLHRVHIAGFTLYSWLLTYLMVWNGKDNIGLLIYTLAIGLHIFPITNNLSSHYKALYNRRGSYVLAIAALAGWACGITFDVPKQILFTLLAFVAGGVVVNSLLSEIPRQRKGKYYIFVGGALFYTILLLLLSHFEKVR